MSDIAIGRQPAAAGLMRPITFALLLAIGLLAFAGMLVLGAFAPDLQSGRNGGAHALSNGATGFAALVELAQAGGRNVRIVRDPRQFDTESLLVITPERASTEISEATRREAKPTLVILPKWQTVADRKHRGWVKAQGLLPEFEPEGVFAPGVQLKIARRRTAGKLLNGADLSPGVKLYEPRVAQVITGLAPQAPVQPPRFRPVQARAAAPDHDAENDADNRTEPDRADPGAPTVPGVPAPATAPARPTPPRLTPLLSDAQGGILLAQIGDGPLYVLADPDLLNNQGMKSLDQARAALALLDSLNSTPPDTIVFDVSLNGFGHSKSPLRLMFEPPFLAVTLTILAALVLAGIQAFARFGPPAPRGRAIAFGKTVLVDNSAALVRKARREAAMGPRYVAVIRERAARVFGAPARLRDAALDDYLDAFSGPRRFTECAAAVEAARNAEELREAARALHAWLGDRMEKGK